MVYYPCVPSDADFSPSAVSALPGPSPAQSADNPHETTITGNDITSDLRTSLYHSFRPYTDATFQSLLRSTPSAWATRQERHRQSPSTSILVSRLPSETAHPVCIRRQWRGQFA